MCPIYEFQHPETGEIFKELRSVNNRNKKFYAQDGVECERVISTMGKSINRGKEGWERFPNYYKEMKPKYVKDKKGRRERYDSTKHF